MICFGWRIHLHQLWLLCIKTLSFVIKKWMFRFPKKRKKKEKRYGWVDGVSWCGRFLGVWLPIFTLLPILSNLHATNALSWILRNNSKGPKIRPKISWNCCKNVVKILWTYHFSSSLIVFEFKSENTYFYYLRKLDVIRFYVSKSFYNEYLYKI